MANDTQSSNSGLSIQADDRNGHISGTGAVHVNGDKGSVMAAFTAQGNGQTQVSLDFLKDVAVTGDASLAFGGHADLDPNNGKWSAGTSATYTVSKDVAAKLQAQFGPDGLNAQASVHIRL